MRTLLYSVYTFSLFAIENMMALFVVLALLFAALAAVIVVALALAAALAWAAYLATTLGLFP